MELSEEEMASIEAALAAATPSFLSSSATPATRSPSQFQRKGKSIQPITSPPSKAKRRLSFCAEFDIEDLGSLWSAKKNSSKEKRSPKKISSKKKRSAKKRSRVAETSFFHRFRSETGLYVSDVTSTEWCQKQMEFVLLRGKRKTTKAMKAGSARHTELEEEICNYKSLHGLQVVKKVKIRGKSKEDKWALKLLNFIIGVNQLLFEGLTRELPLIGFAEGIWMVGVIDEIRMPATESDRNPILVDTKTRVRDTLPAEPQRRNGRLQLMCYKYMWDNLVADHFPSKQFFDFFTLNRHSVLSKEIRERTADSGFPAETLDGMVRLYRNTCSMLPPAHDQLLLRYEFQKDNSLLGEDQFAFDSDWLKNQIQGCLEFWLGEREACYTPEEERWKCRYCQFASICPANTDSDS